jgi:hypothetical protein
MRFLISLSFVRNDVLFSLVIPSQRWTAGKGREGISKLRPFFIFNNAKDVVKNYSAAADNIRPIEIPDLTIVRQE